MSQQITVNVMPGSYEAGQKMAEFAGAVKDALANGWNPAMDIPPIIASALANLVPAIAGISKIPAEYAQDKQALLNGMFLGMSSMTGKFLP